MYYLATYSMRAHYCAFHFAYPEYWPSTPIPIAKQSLTSISSLLRKSARKKLVPLAAASHPPPAFHVSPRLLWKKGAGMSQKTTTQKLCCIFFRKIHEFYKIRQLAKKVSKWSVAFFLDTYAAVCSSLRWFRTFGCYRSSCFCRFYVLRTDHFLIWVFSWNLNF
jgi:hypothetical protein